MDIAFRKVKFDIYFSKYAQQENANVLKGILQFCRVQSMKYRDFIRVFTSTCGNISGCG